MWDGLLCRNSFRAKCKTTVNRTRLRLDVIKKKRNAMQKFLKKDIAELLKCNLEANAYGRAEGLYKELNLSSCYDFVEKCCACIMEHVKEIQKERECPEECKVAVASLIYAAARFADLPELRDLRSQFHEKYGKALEPFTSQDFAEKMKGHPPSAEMKLQLMQEIAQEFSVAWDPRSLEEQLQNQVGASDGHKFSRSKSDIVQGKERQEIDENQTNEEETSTSKSRVRHSQSCLELNPQELLQEQSSMQEHNAPLSTSGTDDNANRTSTNRVHPAPPYTIPEKEDQFHIVESNESSDCKAKPRPRSVRTKYLKQSRSTHVKSSTEQERDVREISSARAPHEVRHGVHRKGKENTGEEEESMDGVLKYFSKQKSFNGPESPKNTFNVTHDQKDLGIGQPLSELPLPPGRRRYLFTESPPVSPLKEDDTESKSMSRFVPPDDHHHPEQQPPAEPTRVSRHTKSSSFGHVHPNLPDIDDLAQKIASLSH